MYKLLAYRVSLKGRHQIFENLKVLKILWPTIVFFTIVAPIGVMLAVSYNITFEQQSPGGLFFLTYNPAFIMIFLYLLKNRLKPRKVIPYSIHTDHLPVISAMGQRLPTSCSTDAYFKDLQKQWNS
uniref:Uncharacterized protein n=1 Tax=Panagrolaimus sp. PS1159 TaxID=55785 RepID=A0AC35EWY4_9BILA